MQMMTMKKHLFLLLLLLFLPLALCAAPTKKFSKNYKNARLEVVLNDLCKRFDYQLVVDPNDIDMDKRITYSFKQVSAGSVLKRCLDKDLTYKIKKGKIYINKKPLPPTVFTSTAQTPSSIEENDTLKLTIWNDTIYSVTCKTVTKEVTSGAQKTAPKKTSSSKGKGKKKSSKQSEEEELPYKGHHIWFGVGGGYADLGYSLREADNSRAGKVHGSFGGVAQLQYAYFFHENWGIGAGVGFSHYTSYGILNTTKRFPGQTDTDGEAYNHLAVTHDWKERQAAYLVDIPVEVLFHYPLQPNLGIYAGLGVKAGLIMRSTWGVKSGTVEHQGEYPAWGLTLSEVDGHDFFTESYKNIYYADGSKLPYLIHLQLPAIGLMADLGMTIKLNEQLNLMVGAFFNYTCNNVRTDETIEMGWRADGYSGELAYRNHDFMNSYSGMIASEYVKAVRPWEVGLKIGIDWRHKPKEKAPQPEYERIQICDTTITLQQRVDTVHKPKPEVVKQIVRLMETSVIWYDLDSTEPKLKPADILDKIAAILIENPKQHILINGHASKEGTALHNKRLSENRAKIIYNMLLEKGVKAEQMTAQGFGVDKSYVEGEHEISLDRRVEIIPVND
jgi:outer membrane protein OmpA-like peptidoglycan-associated protein